MAITKGEDILPFIGQLENAGKDPNLINTSNPDPDKQGIGLYQITRGTDRLYGGTGNIADLKDPTYNTNRAKQILNDLHSRLGDDPRVIAAGYNTTLQRAKQFKDTGNVNALLPETQAYIKKFDAIYKPSGDNALPPTPPVKPTPVAAQTETPAAEPAPQVPIDLESQLGSFGVHGKMLLEDGWLAKNAAMLRSKGATWDQVHMLMNEQWDKLRAAGGTDEQIERLMGFRNPMAIDSRIRDHVSTALAAMPAPAKTNGMWEAMLAGAQNSVVGMMSDMAQGKGGLPEFEIADDATRSQRIAYNVMQGIGDYPAMFAGWLGTRSMAGAAALPTAIKAAIADGYSNGMYRDGSDAAGRISHIAWETAKSAAEAKAFGMVGGRAASLTTKFALQKFGQKLVTEEGAKWGIRAVKAASGAAYWAGGLGGQTAAQAVLEQQIPSMNDVIDNGISMLFLHGVTSLDRLPAVKKNIMDRWTTTNARPADTLADATKDPSLYTDMVTHPNSKVPPGSSITETGVPGEQHVIAREKGTFDDAVKGELQRNEPGVRYGIDSKHFPDVDLSTLTPEAAADLMHTKLWQPLGLKDFPPEIQGDLLKLGAREGVDKAREVLESIDKMPQTLREEMEKQTVDGHFAPENARSVLRHNPEWLKLQEMMQKHGLSDLRGAVEKGMEEHMPKEAEPPPPQQVAIKAKNGQEHTFSIEDTTTEGKKAAVIRNDRTVAGRKVSKITSSVSFTDSENARVIGETALHTSLRGQGVARGLYQHLADEALADGRELHSDKSVSDDAMQVYKSLERAGYKIERNENVERGDGTTTSTDGQPVLRITKGPTAKPAKPAQIPAGAIADPARGPGAYKWADPLAKVGEGMAPRTDGLKTFSEAWHLQIYREMWNQRAPINRLFNAIHNGEPLNPNDNALLHLRDEETSGQRARAMYERELKPILDQFKPGKELGGLDHFEKYLVAYRAQAEHENGVKNAVDPEAAAQIVREAPAHFKEALDGIIKFRGKLMDYMRDRGMFSQEDIDTFMKESRYGIPGWREREKPSVQAPKGSRIWNPVRKVKGSGDKYVSPFEALVHDTFTRIALADRNATIRSLAPLAAEKGLATDEVVAKTARDPDQNTTMEGSSEEALQRWSGKRLADDEVAYFDNGEMHIAKFEDPGVTKVLRHYDDQGQSLIMKLISAPSRLTREFIVRQPLFAPVIGPMDQFFQGVFGKGFFGEHGALPNYAIGMWHTMLRTEQFQKAVDAGLVSHFYESLSRDDMIKATLRGKAPEGFLGRTWNGVHAASEWWNQSWLSSPTVGDYVRAIKRGDDPLLARTNASEAVFHRAAFGGQVSRNINSMVPFFTAHLNGLEKTAKALIGAKNELGQSYSAKASWAKAIGLITLPMLYSWAANKDKDWYKAMHDYEKDNYLPLRIGGDGPEGYTYKFRLPPMVGTIFGGMPRRFAQMMVDHDPHAFEDIRATLAESFKPPGMETFGPSWVTPLLENYANRNFQTGRPIVSDREREQLLPYARFKPYTTETAKFIGDALGRTGLTRGGGISPDMIDHLIKGWTGNAGMSLLQAIEHMAGAKASGPEFKWQDLPEFNSMIARYPSAGAEPINKYYDRMDTYNQVHGTLLDAMKRNDIDGFKKVLADHPEMAAMHRWQLGKGELAAMAQSSIDPTPFANELAKLQHTKMDEETAARVIKGKELMQNWNMTASAARNSTKLTPHEKSQIMEMAYLNLQRTAETITRQMDKAGWK